MGILIDTSVFVDLERRGIPHVEVDAREVSIAAITASELLHGVHRADSAVRRHRREAFVEAILGAVVVVPFDLAIARVHSRLWADLRAAGQAVGSHDLLIAATAIARGDTVLTANVRDFAKVEGLSVVRWPE